MPSRVSSLSLFSQAAAGMETRAGAIVEAHANLVLANAIESMSGPKSGTVYGEHQASAPGEPPAIDLGDLANSGSAVMVGPTTAEITFAAPHAPHLEFGTVHVEARPFLTPALTQSAEAFVEAMKEVADVR
ncbi:MAG TPA: hypothetical protein VGE07_01505 [Herpetosiphonaceae bacterium]